MATLCTSAQALFQAGANVSSALTSQSDIIDNAITGAESTINAVTRFDWVAAYPTLISAQKLILNSTAAKMAGGDLVDYDKSGYTGDNAGIKMDRLQNDVNRNLGLLKDQKRKVFINGS